MILKLIRKLKFNSKFSGYKTCSFLLIFCKIKIETRFAIENILNLQEIYRQKRNKGLKSISYDL